MCYQPEGYKTLTISAVSKTFHNLLLMYGETTSLEVKNYLRKQGYWAVQEDVAPVIRLLAAEEDIDFDFNGLFRTYYKEEEIEAFEDEVNFIVQIRSFNLT